MASLNTSLDLSDPANKDAKSNDLLNRLNKLRNTNGLSAYDKMDALNSVQFKSILENSDSESAGTRINAYGDLLAMGGVNADHVDETVDRLSRAFRDKSYGVNLGGVEVPTPTAAFGSTAVDSVMQGTGRLMKGFGDFVEKNPVVDYALEGLDFAGGPALYLAKKAITKLTDVGEKLEEFQQRVVGLISEKMKSTGYNESAANDGGVGGLVIGSMVGGAAATKFALNLMGKFGIGKPSATHHETTPDHLLADNVQGHGGIDFEVKKAIPGWARNAKTPDKRHHFDKINMGSLTKETNTVIHPGMRQSVIDDMAAIRNGLGEHAGDFVTVNGRVYSHHGGTVYPVSGDGFVTLDRVEYSALKVYKTHGDTDMAATILGRQERALLESEIRKGADMGRATLIMQQNAAARAKALQVMQWGSTK